MTQTFHVSAVVFDWFGLTLVCFFCRDKINELHEWMCQLESEKFDHMERLKRQKYEVRASRCSLSDHEVHCVNPDRASQTEHELEEEDSFGA